MYKGSTRKPKQSKLPLHVSFIALGSMGGLVKSLNQQRAGLDFDHAMDQASEALPKACEVQTESPAGEDINTVQAT